MVVILGGGKKLIAVVLITMTIILSLPILAVLESRLQVTKKAPNTKA